MNPTVVDVRESPGGVNDSSPAGVPLGCVPQDAVDRRRRFLAELAMMTPEERIRGSRYSFMLWERTLYAAHYPDEVPLLNGVYEWIAVTLE